MHACFVFCRFVFCENMADIAEQLPTPALGKIMTCLGVEYLRSFKRRLTLAKRYSEDLSAFFRLNREYANGCGRRWQMFRLANEYGLAALFSQDFREYVPCLLLLCLADLRLPCKHHHRFFFPKHCHFMLRS